MLATEHALAWAGLVAGLSVVVRPTRVACAFVFLWYAAIAGLTLYQGGSFGAAYAPFAHATRYGAPALLFVALAGTWAKMRGWIEFGLRWATAITFVAHGFEAVLANPRFIDFVITAFRRISWEVSESTTRVLLRIIGVQDLVLAGLIVTKRYRAVALWMAIWGGIAAASRMVHMGIPKWPATVMRAANAGVPLALYFLWAPSPQSPSTDEEE